MSNHFDQTDRVATASPAERPPAGDAASPPPTRRTNAAIRRLVILGMIAIVAVPLAISEFPREVAKWYAAAAMEKYLDGDLPAALQVMDQAIARDAANANHFRLRGQWRREAMDYEGSLADCSRAVELAPQDLQNYLERTQALQHLGRHREAVDDWNHVIEMSESRATRLTKLLGAEAAIAQLYNGRAYARALGNVELDEGLKDVQRAIDVVGRHPAYLDTRGYLYCQRGDLQQARADFDAALDGYEAIDGQLSKGMQSIKNQVVDLRKLDKDLREQKLTLAVIHYHRALLMQKLGQQKAAEDDFKRVKELGYEPNEHLF
jgi:tetratricopeptide (TPR) repeat protein